MQAAPEPGAIYEVELCSGERRRWQCLAGAGGTIRWRDLDSGCDCYYDDDCGPAGPLYAWWIVGRIEHLPDPEKGFP